MVNITIDKQPIAVKEGTTILDAAKQVHIHIPTLCYLNLEELKMVNKVASCRICVVEVEGRRNLAPSCATPVFEGMKITTNSRRVLRSRRKILELLLSAAVMSINQQFFIRGFQGIWHRAPNMDTLVAMGAAAAFAYSTAALLQMTAAQAAGNLAAAAALKPVSVNALK